MYKRRDSLAILFDISIRMVDKLVSEIEKEKRYPKDSILRDKGYVLVDVDVFKDYLQNRKLLKSESGRKKVPPFVRDQLRYLKALDNI